MFSQVADRRRLALPLVFPCFGGLWYLWALGAPERLIAVNAGALALGLAWVVWGRLPSRPEIRLALAALGAGLLFVPLFTGPDVGGVARWFPAGPVTLQSGPLLLPLIAVLAAREGSRGAAVLALAAIALALQPDAAGLAALALASAVLGWHHRNGAFAAVALGAGALATITFHAGTLEPQLYTEGVLAHVAERTATWRALPLAALLFIVPAWNLTMDPQITRAEGYALAALIIGLGGMAAIAPFPFPLIGYGAAPILGFALALGASARRKQIRVGEFVELWDRVD
ncbi:MAG: hypothetical protein ACOVQY_12375 [Erythrobacter sp.]